ncbi:MAG TPA: UDP-N-acetylmuramoyl-L-alanyl-D-glutamate--2,6-diaminopimelate ligase [Prevotellaceae bacterium]|jgi:UDP-N-acetylmuramoyl-L-alanyl-D-glutamate--2,6-diaminopimelate ligase|nr:UDP-N-acetylmuramoyl-L-alanyl-D-glutamate--2,6-diaminopimelate ligase [Prevotellaceae bacterium]
MNLKDILHDVQLVEVKGTKNREVTGIQIDSRQIQSGDIFVAIRGTQSDGHQFIPMAIEKGSGTVICEQFPKTFNEDVTYVRVENTEKIVGLLATRFYGNPTRKLKLVGVTGTNGKTTIATLLYEMFRKLGYKCGLCSTVCNYVDGEPYPTSQTTPDPITLNKLLGEMADKGCEYAFMEVSSHAICQHRIGGLHFTGGIFTNLTRDHLDYHKTFENYRDAKKAFFDQLTPDAFAITNADDKNGMVMVQNCKAEIKTYSQQRLADFHTNILDMTFQGMELIVNGTEVHIPLVGKFNVSNILAIYGAAMMLGQSSQEVLTVLSALHSVSGRFEALQSPKGYTAIVDYAHTPDALVNVLCTIHEVLRGKGHILTVCGCGGNRDKGKRPQMAFEAAKLSDRVILTSDNPRFEEPEDILKDMLAGIQPDQKNKVVTIVERAQAIQTACFMASAGDVILVAGKGHENYQDVKGVKHHFDDKEILCEIFKKELS